MGSSVHGLGRFGAILQLTASTLRWDDSPKGRPPPLYGVALVLTDGAQTGHLNCEEVLKTLLFEISFVPNSLINLFRSLSRGVKSKNKRTLCSKRLKYVASCTVKKVVTF